MGYDGLEVTEGTEAGRVWRAMIESEDFIERERMEGALRTYCRHDTLAMVRVHEALAELTL